MDDMKKLEKFSVDELLQELRSRETKAGGPAAAAFSQPRSDLSVFDSGAIVNALMVNQKVVYGTDDRLDVFQLPAGKNLDDVDGVVALFSAADVADNGNGTSTLQTENFGTANNLCASERFRDQPKGAFCSGFLVAADIIATAGHCVNAGNVTNVRFVFGFRMRNATTAETVINNGEIYSGAAIIGRQEIGTGADWALVRLDRPVANHRILPIRRTGVIGNTQAIHVIGHPVGLPTKFAGGATVRDNTPNAFFVANLDTYGGNSGSPVFNSNTHEVEGILVRGETDFVSQGTCMVSLVCPTSGCRGEDCTRTTEFADLVPAPSPDLHAGTYTIQQKSSNRFVDAHESSGNDFSVVTRTAQNNDTQRWIITPVGWVYTLQQKSNGRFMDAHESSGNDFSVVTRTAQNNDTQRWVFMHLENSLCTYTVQQLSTSRFMDAHESSDNDFSVVTRTAQNNDTQRWVLVPLGNNTYSLQQKSSSRFMDAHESSANDFSVVTRTAQNNDTQRWTLTPVGGVYTIQQKSNGRLMDAHESSANDFSVVTRITQNNNTQRWVFLSLGNNTYTVQQLSSSRFMDAHESSTNDFSVVTRTAQNNDTQRWIIKPV